MGAEEDEEDVSAILLPRPAVKLSMDLPTIPLPQPRSSTPPVVVAPTTSARSGFKFKRTLASTTASPSTTTSPSTPASASTPAAGSTPASSSTPAPASTLAAGSSPAAASTPASANSRTPKPSSRYLSFRILNQRASI